jgi:CubicO group peptidase (beta-lactamase class C family)
MTHTTIMTSAVITTTAISTTTTTMKRNIRQLLFTTLLSFCFIGTSVGQIREQGPVGTPEVTPIPSALPESVGMSSERLAYIDSMITRMVDGDQLPGAVVLVMRNGYLVYEKAFGIANPNSGEYLRTDHIFRIASQTKAITSTAVMMLWERGHFRLDDPVANYIPAFKNPTVLVDFNEDDSTFSTRPAASPITIRQLLTHTSGLGYGIIDGDARMRKIYQKAGVVDLFTTENTSIQESVERLAGLPLHHDPGTKFTYSEGLDVLGYLVEVITGKPYDQFLRDELFEPLGMKDTQFYLRSAQYKRLVSVQTKGTTGNWVEYNGHPDGYYDADYPKEGAKRFFGGGAGLSSTAQDYARFLQMYLNGGVFNEHRILSPTTIDLIMTNQTGDLFGNGKEYHGLAFGVATPDGFAEGVRGSAGTFDWGGYFNTQYYADPELGLIGIIMKQTRQIAGEPTGQLLRQIIAASVVEK